MQTSTPDSLLRDVAYRIRDAFTYDPGHSDLDDEQPISISVTLGDWRKLDRALSAVSERVDRVELGCAGHLIVARYCRWKRHTQVGKYRISSIGDYYSPGATRREGDEKRTTIGAGDDAWFETMVFETVDWQDDGNEGCGCRHVKDWSEIDGERYATAGEAQAGHERFVAKYQGMK